VSAETRRGHVQSASGHEYALFYAEKSRKSTDTSDALEPCMTALESKLQV
jgi:hypothetical protein